MFWGRGDGQHGKVAEKSRRNGISSTTRGRTSSRQCHILSTKERNNILSPLWLKDLYQYNNSIINNKCNKILLISHFDMILLHNEAPHPFLKTLKTLGINSIIIIYILILKSCRLKAMYWGNNKNQDHWSSRSFSIMLYSDMHSPEFPSRRVFLCRTFLQNLDTASVTR